MVFGTGDTRTQEFLNQMLQRWKAKSCHEKDTKKRDHLGWKPLDYIWVSKDIVEKLKLSLNDELLDVGCGACNLLSLLARHVKKAVGIDFDPHAIRKASEAYKNLELHVGEASDLPFRDDRFDRVLAFGFLEYLPSHGHAESVLREMFRVCKPDGLVMLGDVIPSPGLPRRVWSWLKYDLMKAEGGELKFNPMFFQNNAHGAKRIWIYPGRDYYDQDHRFDVVMRVR